MADVLISALPQYTGVTSSGWFIFNNSGETTTYKANVYEIFNNGSTFYGLEAQGAETNINIFLRPKGNGAIVSDKNNDARGQYAVDFQVGSTSSTKVASGASAFAAGLDNTASGQYSSVFGYNNISSSYATFAGGQQSQATGLWAFAYGFNSVASQNQSVAMGRLAFALAEVSFATGDESYSVASRAFASGWGTYSSASAGYAHGGRKFNQQGDNQYVRMNFSLPDEVIGSAGQAYLSLQGYSGGIDLSYSILNNSTNGMMQVNAKWNAVCKVSGGGGSDPAANDVAGGEIVFTIKNIGGTASLVGSVHTVDTNSDASMSGVTVLPDISNNSLRMQFTAPTTTGNNTYRINCVVSAAQLGW